jgi:hypothetical protein
MLYYLTKPTEVPPEEILLYKKKIVDIYTLFNTGGVYCMRSFYAVAFDKKK